MKLPVHTIGFRYRVKLPAGAATAYEDLITPDKKIDVEVDLDKRLVKLEGAYRSKDGTWRVYVPFENVGFFQEAAQGEQQMPEAPRARKGRTAPPAAAG